MSRRQRKRLYQTVVLLGIGCLFTLVAVLVRPFYTINLWLSDQLFTTEQPSPNIVIAGIDDDTLAAYGRWAEWPRSLHARAVDNLSQAGAKVIGFDVVFADSSPDDEMLAATMTDTGNVVLASVGTQDVKQVNSLVTFEQFLLPVTELELAASNIGHANIIPDPDGTVRRLPLIIQTGSAQLYPAFSLAVLYRLFSMSLPQEYPLQSGTVNLLARDIPVDNSYYLRINFAADDQQRPYISYGDIISGSFDPELVKNKIVLIGMTATGEPDTWAVPTQAGKIPGVYIHAAAMDSILTQRFLIESGTAVTLLTMLLLTGITAFTLPWCGTWYWTDIAKGAGVTGGLFVIYLLTSFFAFDAGYVLDLLYPLLLLPVVYVGNIFYMAINEQSDKRFVKDLFGKYISPQVAREIINRADTGVLQLGGEEREVTVLFADVRNFTRISEGLSPEVIVKMLNTYLSVVVDTVVRNHGIVNKFGGDNVMAVWNAPQSQPEHALLSVKAAWEIQQGTAKLHQSDAQLLALQFGIGVNTGIALAGNVGSVGRAEYTVIGDTVNTASRICGTAPGGEVLIGADTYDQIKDYIETERLKPQTVKGKEAPIVIYRVVSWKTTIPGEPA